MRRALESARGSVDNDAFVAVVSNGCGDGGRQVDHGSAVPCVWTFEGSDPPIATVARPRAGVQFPCINAQAGALVGDAHALPAREGTPLAARGDHEVAGAQGRASEDAPRGPDAGEVGAGAACVSREIDRSPSLEHNAGSRNERQEDRHG